jgi:protein gp37
MKKTKIEWTEATWNPTVGCNPVSEGCQNCYAKEMANRLKAMGNPDYENGFDFTLLPNRLRQPIVVKRQTIFFVNSMSDIFHEKMPKDFFDAIFKTIEQTPRHVYQLLTKREQNMLTLCGDRVLPENVWVGVTIENKKTKRRIDPLRQINAKVRFLSIEPLLEDLGELDLTGIHWVIVGGESGNNARPMKLQWVENIRLQCEEQNVPFFFKQWGAYGEDGVKRNKKLNESSLGGREYREMPREMPKIFLKTKRL